MRIRFCYTAYMSLIGPERRFAAMQRYSRYRRKTGLVTDGLDPALLTLKRHGTYAGGTLNL
jgi:hypothetical protein